MATSLLKRGENAIVIFTYGKYFRKMKDGSGSTGNWVIDEKRKCNKVVIYNRTHRGNEVYVAKRTALTPSKEAGRFVIKLNNIEYYGCTYFNWVQFAGSRNPIRYFKIASQSRGKRRGNGTGDAGINLELLPSVE
jgi:hypothetical protein